MLMFSNNTKRSAYRARHFRVTVSYAEGEADQFLAEQLKPEALEAAAQKAGHDLILNRHEGYDHSYYFISSFIDQHLRFHAQFLKG